MLGQIRSQLAEVILRSLDSLNIQDKPSILIDSPAERTHGELSINVAMQLARSLKKNPLTIANELAALINQNMETRGLKPYFDKVEVKAPGFINFFLSRRSFYGILEEVFVKDRGYGASDFGKGTRILIEFVSANPTGPLTVAHGRQAAVGDSLVNIMRAAGFDAKKEYYINDEGNQINILGRSIKERAKEILGMPSQFPEDGYQGAYIKTMAQQLLTKEGVKTGERLEKLDMTVFNQFGVDYLMDCINKDLKDFGVEFDHWSNQSKIATVDEIKKVVEYLRARGFIYDHEGAVWFKSTAFGDDKDRVVQKSDGAYTYLTPDIVYHKYKYERGFNRIVDVLGPDHHGYIPRIKAAAGALGYDPDSLDVLIIQLATIYRNGKPVSMSTRRGEFITLREVMDEVGVDAGRFFFLMRQTSAHLEFDLELAKKQSNDNPVYYIQYAHARINSILRKAKDEQQHAPKVNDFAMLKEAEELELIRKIGLFPDTLVACSKQLDPFGLGRYLQELAASFHKFYDSHRVLADDPQLSAERLGLINATKIVLANGLRLLGLSAPEKM